MYLCEPACHILKDKNGASALWLWHLPDTSVHLGSPSRENKNTHLLPQYTQVVVRTLGGNHFKGSAWSRHMVALIPQAYFLVCKMWSVSLMCFPQPVPCGLRSLNNPSAFGSHYLFFLLIEV